MRIFYWILIIIGFTASFVSLGSAIWFTMHLVSGWSSGYDYQKEHILRISILFFTGLYALDLTGDVLDNRKDELLKRKDDIFKNYPFSK